MVEQVSASVAVACSESDTCIGTLDGIEPVQLEVRGIIVEPHIEKMGKLIVGDVPRISVDALARFLVIDGGHQRC